MSVKRDKRKKERERRRKSGARPHKKSTESVGERKKKQEKRGRE
jgi:hypothetical protein